MGLRPAHTAAKSFAQQEAWWQTQGLVDALPISFRPHPHQFLCPWLLSLFNLLQSVCLVTNPLFSGLAVETRCFVWSVLVDAAIQLPNLVTISQILVAPVAELKTINDQFEEFLL